MTGVDGLVAALRRQVLALEDDLRARVDDPDTDLRQPGVAERWQGEHAQALRAQRTAASWQAWRDERVTQAAVAWALVTVFARYCEDNALVSRSWIAGPAADARGHALDARRAYFTANPEHTDRDWLWQIVEHFAALDATKGLVDEFSPLHQVAPSGDAAQELLEFWWDQDETGALRWSFAGVDTRFLGDAYQDLSEHAKKTYALLQTPEFVEEFILDQTLEPALAERPLEGFTVIDPTCGSGHFLLGAFKRLLARWQNEAPALGPRVLVQKALEGVYGVDINPFAVAIARFRLMVAALEASGDRSIEKLIDIRLNLATGDSLLFGALQQTTDDDPLTFAYSIEDAATLRRILHRQHDVVVGNPPYITVKDAALSAAYRGLYDTCHRKYALTVPFMELFFGLAHSGEGRRRAGWVGQITSNSFMKREFGSKLIEQFLCTRDLYRVIDTSGAYIPGHGTPTVILVGRNRSPMGDTVRAVLGIRGEPGRPDDAAKGIVWSAIVEHVDEPGFDDGWISVVEFDRSTLRSHPWSLSGGGAVITLAEIESGRASLDTRTARIGVFGMTNADDVMLAHRRDFRRKDVPSEMYRPLVLGDEIRDWDIDAETHAFFPYGEPPTYPDRAVTQASLKWIWPCRTTLGNRATFSKQTYFEEGRDWRGWHQLTRDSGASICTITFAFVATHNHFALDRGGKVFKQSAPVIKLPAGASEDDHLKLLGVLNSSVACFWLKQKNYPGGGDPVGDEGARVSAELWSERYQFNSGTLKELPLPSFFPLSRASILDSLAQELATHTPNAVTARTAPTAEALDSARKESERIRGLMFAHQEELDWDCYRLYGLIDEDLTYSGELPGLALGERVFEIVLARALRDGEHTAWFERHRSTPLTDFPTHLPADYRELMQRRLDAIAQNPHLRLLEKPEHKRRWAIEPWDKRVSEALRDWLLDRVEERSLWFDRDDRPTPRSVAQLADELDRDEDFRGVLRLWAQSPEASTAAALQKLLAEEGVPFLAALRYKPAGLEKRAAWEHTWALQRREDAGERLDGPIPVPPKYKLADFVTTAYWARRGKLDVPKERFVSYPGANRESDPSEFLGWAGWDHAEQALALAGIIADRVDDGWDGERMKPLLAGFAELVPWVRQWHAQLDEYGESVADTIETELRSRCQQLGVSLDDAVAWRPAPATRGRRSRKEATPA